MKTYVCNFFFFFLVNFKRNWIRKKKKNKTRVQAEAKSVYRTNRWTLGILCIESRHLKNSLRACVLYTLIAFKRFFIFYSYFYFFKFIFAAPREMILSNTRTRRSFYIHVYLRLSIRFIRRDKKQPFSRPSPSL